MQSLFDLTMKAITSMSFSIFITCFVFYRSDRKLRETKRWKNSAIKLLSDLLGRNALSSQCRHKRIAAALLNQP
jgi:hypothetical protein